MLDYLRVCEKAVRAGGAILLEKIGRVNVREKGRSDLVTEADVASEETVRRTILAAFPDHLVIGEEDPRRGRGGEGHAGDEAEYRWFLGFLIASTILLTICLGVAKSGFPIPRSMMSSPLRLASVFN